MTTGHVFIAVSLDGFIARPNGDIDWLDNQGDPNSDNGFGEMMDSVDGLIMGRATFEKVLSFGGWHYEKPVIVLSRTMKQSDVPGRLSEKVRVSNSAPKQLMNELSLEGWSRAYIDGGKVIQSFLSDRLIETLWITHVPILIGQGLPLFGPLSNDIELEHLETRDLAGLVSSKYRVK